MLFGLSMVWITLRLSLVPLRTSPRSRASPLVAFHSRSFLTRKCFINFDSMLRLLMVVVASSFQRIVTTSVNYHPPLVMLLFGTTNSNNKLATHALLLALLLMLHLLQLQSLVRTRSSAPQMPSFCSDKPTMLVLFCSTPECTTTRSVSTSYAIYCSRF